MPGSRPLWHWHRIGRCIQPYRIRTAGISTWKDAMAKGALTGTPTPLTGRGTIFLLLIHADTAAGGGSRPCRRSTQETPSFVKFITGEGGVIDTWLRRGAAQLPAGRGRRSPPHTFICKNSCCRQAGKPGKVPAGRSLGGCHHQIRLWAAPHLPAGQRGWTVL